MAQSLVTGATYALDSAPIGANPPANPILAGSIVIASGANAGNAAVSTAKATGFLGVTQENSDARGYAAVAAVGVVDVIAGAAVAFGNLIVSNASGQGVPVTLAASGAVTQVVGIALTAQPTAGQTFKMLIQPMLGLS